MHLIFTPPTPEDLPEIMAIENAGFTPEEAAAEAAMAERIRTIADSFIVARTSGGRIAGYVVGPVTAARYISDGLFAQSRPNPATGGFQTILSLATHPDLRSQGIASRLLEELAASCRRKQREGITLTCLENLIPFYQKHGYANEGVSASEHAGEVWYNLVKTL